MQRLGRKGHPMYRVVVQDSRQSPDSGKYVALLGSYDPHTKTVNLTKDKAELYLKNGAQPSERVVKLFKAEKIALPAWVKDPVKQERKIRNPEKLRKNRPADAPAPEKPADETPVEEAAPQTPAEATAEAEAPSEEPKGETAAAEPVADEQSAEAEKPEEKAEATAEAEPSDAKPEDQKA